jgi:membrane protease YdiL (CAAX protease family)
MKPTIHKSIVKLYVAMFLLLFAFQFIIIYFSNIDFSNEANITTFNSATNLGFYGLLTTLFIVLFLPFWKAEWVDFKTNVKRYMKTVLIGFAFMFGISIVIGLIYQFIGITDTSVNQEQLNRILEGTLFDQISLVLFAVFFAPIVEEIVFRKAFFGFFRDTKVNRWIIIVLSSFVFGFVHVALALDFEQIFYYAGLGLILGYFYDRTGNIIIPIGIHLLHNGFVTASMFISL